MSRDDDRLLPFDETISGEPCPTPEDPALQRALLEQRFVHGLLRAMHGDACSREARVAAILDRIPRRRSWRRPLIGAAAVLLVGTLLYVESVGRELPRVEAMVEQALEQLARPVDQRYSIAVSVRAVDGTDAIDVDYALTVGGGGRFLLKGDGLLGPMEVGSDGDIIWCQPAISLLRWSKPRKHSSRLGTMLSDNDVEAGEVDLHGLIQGLTKHAGNVTVQRVVTPAEGSRVRVEARDVSVPARRPGRAPCVFDMLAFEVADGTGVLHRVELERRPVPNWTKHLVFEYQGAVVPGETSYRRPW